MPSIDPATLWRRHAARELKDLVFQFNLRTQSPRFCLVEDLDSVVAGWVGLRCRRADLNVFIEHAFKQTLAVDRQARSHQGAELVPREARDRTTFLLVVQRLRMFHVGGGEYVCLCAARDLILQDAGWSVFALDLAAA